MTKRRIEFASGSASQHFAICSSTRIAVSRCVFALWAAKPYARIEIDAQVLIIIEIRPSFQPSRLHNQGHSPAILQNALQKMSHSFPFKSNSLQRPIEQAFSHIWSPHRQNGPLK
jgi:hypothetical protein